jgi:coproporphyrinogen III oxidase
MSMPPLVKWEYKHKVKEGSAEEKLYSNFLVAKKWV